jgi:NAD+ diphosphatase
MQNKSNSIVEHPMEMNYCRRCGGQLTHGKRNAYKCVNGHGIFTNPAPCVGIFFITSDNHVLLSKRGIEPHKGMLDSFGGFVDNEDASIEAAAARELEEELSLRPDEYESLHFIGTAAAPYPFEGEDQRIMSILFWTRLTTDRELVPSDDVEAVVSLPLHEVNVDTLHGEDIKIGIGKLQDLFPKQTI